MTQEKPTYTDNDGNCINEKWADGRLVSVFVTGKADSFTERTEFDKLGNKLSVFYHSMVTKTDIEQYFKKGILIREVKDEPCSKKNSPSWEIRHTEREYFPGTKTLKKLSVVQGNITDDYSFFESGKIATHKQTKENCDFYEVTFDEKGNTLKRAGKLGQDEFYITHDSFGRIKEECRKNSDGYEYKHYIPDGLGTFCDKEIKRDSHGKGYEKVYRANKTLDEECQYFGKSWFIKTEYESDGKSPWSKREEKGRTVKNSFYEKGKLIRSEVGSRESGDLEIKYLDAKNRLTSSRIIKTLEDGYRTEYFDAKGKLTGYVIEKELRDDNKNHVVSRYAPDGKLIKQERRDYEQGKYVEIMPDRFLLHKMFDLIKGGTMGDVAELSVSEERKQVNKKLRTLLKSSAEARKVVATYRATQGKAPNPKVHKKLMEIHQSTK